MNGTTEIEPITSLKAHSPRFIQLSQVFRRPIASSQYGRATAVLQDAETYEAQRRTLLLLKFMAQGDQELKRGKGISHADVRKHFSRTLKGLTDA